MSDGYEIRVHESSLDVVFGFLDRTTQALRQRNPQVVLNRAGVSVLRTLREELSRADTFSFSVAFVSPRALALLKQELLDFKGAGTIITSDYLSFNSPDAFWELHALKKHGVDVRIHQSDAFHPKGYVFNYPGGVTAMVGSSNLTERALATNHEWNLKVSATADSDLADQLRDLLVGEVDGSIPLTADWIREYEQTYVPPARPLLHASGLRNASGVAPASIEPAVVTPNQMQAEALVKIKEARDRGAQRALIISATGTGKTMLSALDVRAVNPARMLFVVHREQILDRTIAEYRRVLRSPDGHFGKLTGTTKQHDRRFVFATIQTLSKPDVLAQFTPEAFDYVIVDEAHRADAQTYRRVLGHFAPKFLLGMTATPERGDGASVYELFDYNVPYEIRLNRALDEDMLAPFHYYGIADFAWEDGSTTTEGTDLGRLVAPERVKHILDALDTYGQAGPRPRGLIFCSRKTEARELARLLNGASFRGLPLRVVALTGDDSIALREETVELLESGELDYILTVDVFNEGVDIPTLNQVVMLRQTESSVVFVQQLGRGLRKAPGKDYVVVIDFIGNYAKNYLIPIALFGDESLNKESVREHLLAAEEVGVLSGLSSVRFDRVAQERVLRSIRETKFDSNPNLKAAVELLMDRLGRPPALADFVEAESADPLVLATKDQHYPRLLEKLFRIDPGLSDREGKALELLSSEVLTAKRGHEVVLLRSLLRDGQLSFEDIRGRFEKSGIVSSPAHVQSAIDTLTLVGFSEADQKRYRAGMVECSGDRVALTPEFLLDYRASGAFANAVDDIVNTGSHVVFERYDRCLPFTAGRQYSRKEVARLLCWPRKWMSTMYGYKVDIDRGVCPIFVTLHKSGEISASTAYEDALLDVNTMRWFTRSRRTLQSLEVAAIVKARVTPFVFVKKDDAEGTDFFYLGSASARDVTQTTMPDDKGNQLSVVRMNLRFTEPIDVGLFDYFKPTLSLDS
jgi:superfamily II DNA or RNA helicase